MYLRFFSKVLFAAALLQSVQYAATIAMPLNADTALLSRGTPTNLPSNDSRLGPFTTLPQIRSVCDLLHTSPTLFLERYVMPNVTWIVSSPTSMSTPISGTYNSSIMFAEKALKPLDERFVNSINLTITDVFVEFPSQVRQTQLDFDEIKVCLQLRGDGILKASQKSWQNFYSWNMIFKGRKVSNVFANVDSASVNDAFAN